MHIHTLSIGQPRKHRDERGEWISAIFREPVSGSVALLDRGHEGDRVADLKHHGSPDQAVCCHPLEHYAYWNEQYTDANLGPGGVGENWTLGAGNETTVCVGDVWGVGTALVQVSSPRVPCSKQERKVQLPGFQQRTLETLRTGWYLRVLRAGAVSAGDEVRLEARPHPNHTIQSVNANWHHAFDRTYAEVLLLVPELAEGWKEMLRGRLSRQDGHR